MSGGSEIEDETVFTVGDDDPSLLDILIENAWLDILNEYDRQSRYMSEQ